MAAIVLSATATAVLADPVPTLATPEGFTNSWHYWRIHTPANSKGCQGKRCLVVAIPIVAMYPEPFGIAA
jgi:hypothetical protein